VNDPRNIPEPAIWTNLAAAYGQKAAWLSTHQPTDPDEVARTRQRALDAATKAIEFGEKWKKRIRELLVKDSPGKDPEDNELEIFEHDNAFRQLVGLAMN
jgi:hypothetical protein